VVPVGAVTFTPPGWPAGHLPGEHFRGLVTPTPPSPLPIQPREYHEFLVTPRHRWWRPLLALGMGGGLWFIGTVICAFGAMGWDLSTGTTTWSDYSTTSLKATPALFLANNLGIAAAIPLSGLTLWAVYGQRPRWLSSVVGGFRWRWFGQCFAWLLPLFAVSFGIQVAVQGVEGLSVRPYTWFLIGAILLTTPFQAAGEEYLVRGLAARSIGAWLPRTAGLAVSTAVTAAVFMAMHGAGDPWLNAFYLCFAVAASLLVWRTGGLEASVALHVVNNLTAMVFLPFSDISGMFDRGAGTGDWSILVQVAILLVGVTLVLRQARRRGIVNATAPGATNPFFPPPAPRSRPLP
jgi:membrane protease YdiL (CAAX protease family)